MRLEQEKQKRSPLLTGLKIARKPVIPFYFYTSCSQNRCRLATDVAVAWTAHTDPQQASSEMSSGVTTALFCCSLGLPRWNCRSALLLRLKSCLYKCNSIGSSPHTQTQRAHWNVASGCLHTNQTTALLRNLVASHTSVAQHSKLPATQGHNAPQVQPDFLPVCCSPSGFWPCLLASSLICPPASSCLISWSGLFKQCQSRMSSRKCSHTRANCPSSPGFN